MTASAKHTQRWSGWILRTSNIPAAIALFVMIVAGVLADHQNSVLYRQDQRAKVLASVNVVRARLEGNVNANIQLVRGLSSVIITEPDMTQERFAALATNLFQQNSQLRSVAAAPDLVVSMVYPLAENRRAIGLDYRLNPAQRDAALRARETRELVLAGPVDLVQGGQGFVGRFPVFVSDEKGQDRFWGLLSAVIDVGRLYADSGLTAPDLPVDIAITGLDATGRLGALFYGNAEIIGNDPVTAEVILPYGSWQMAAIPHGGWGTTPPNAPLLRLAMVLAGLLVLAPILISSRLYDERQANIAALHAREKELQRVSRRLKLALDTSQVGVWEYDLETGALTWDATVNEIFGLPADETVRSFADWRTRLHPDDVARAISEFDAAIKNTGSYLSEYRVVVNGRIRNIRAIGTVYHDPGSTPKIVGVNWDVSADVALNEDLRRATTQAEARNRELEAAKASIEYNALHDSLTGLPNRRFLDQMLKQQAGLCRQRGGSVSLLHIDLDRFKQINDTLGHAAGDAMLVHAAEVLKTKVREDDFVARIGGDEFVVLCTSRGRARDLSKLAERITATMREPVTYQGHECRFGVSVGIATESGATIDPQRLLINADIALYRAKSRGRNRHEFFSDALQAEIVNTKRVADDILSGLERNQFVAYYQPQFDAKSHDLVGIEALVRWQHPTAGILAPDKFLRIAEELNVLATIDRMILDQALALQRSWPGGPDAAPHVSVNVSSRRLHDDSLIASLKGLGIVPGSVSFELLESIYLDESDEIVAWNIDQIKELGIDIEIDDFGTGYASIVSLLKLKPRRLKIDRQLVVPIVSSVSQRHLVESIIEIGQSLGIDVVAEGVETMEHASILRDLNCDILQGYAFARPMSADDIIQFAGEQRWRTAS